MTAGPALKTLDERRAEALEALCELIVPGSSEVGPVVYVDALIAGMPPEAREHALASIDALASAGARADDDDVVAVLHAIPMNDQSLSIRRASGELKSMSA